MIQELHKSICSLEDALHALIYLSIVGDDEAKEDEREY